MTASKSILLALFVLFMGMGCGTPVKWAPVEYRSETIDNNFNHITISYSTEKERRDLIQFVKNSN
jgi:glycosyltransferase involved in cell wall biosynthesis